MRAAGDSLERILVDLSTRFASVEGGQIRPEIDQGLQTVARFLEAESYGLIEPLGSIDRPWVLTFRTPHGASPLDAWPDRFLWDPHEAQFGDLILRLEAPESLPASWQEHSLVPRPDARGSIVVPICLGERILGALSFDSHPSRTLASPEHLDQLRSIASIFAHGLQRKRAEEQLEDSLGFEVLLVKLTSILALAPASDVESALAEAAQHLARALCLDQVSLIEVANGPDDARTVFSYGGAGPSLVVPSGKQLQEINDQLLLGEVVRVADGRMLEPEESTPVDAQTLLFVPLTSSASTLCAVSAATRFNPPVRADLMASRLVLAGEILANAWTRAMRKRSLAEEPIAQSSRADRIYIRERPTPEHVIQGVIGTSDVLRYVLFKVHQVAHTDATTLLLGETGTGKGLIARAIHEHSARRDRPMITVNCAALPNGLVETELFGHEKGSYTGAYRSQAGRFEVAHGSSILLDEIGDLPLELQSKLLRILQDGELERVGSTKTLRVDVRVIAATHRDLEDDVREGRFREDLYYRLNVFPITLPPLRDRPEDIPLLVQHFVDRLSVKLRKPIERIPSEVMKALQAHAWPGNVRELESVLTRALIETSDTTLWLTERLDAWSERPTACSSEMTEVERTHISQTLVRHSWRIEGRAGAASALGMHPSTLRGRMRKLHIQRPT